MTFFVGFSLFFSSKIYQPLEQRALQLFSSLAATTTLWSFTLPSSTPTSLQHQGGGEPIPDSQTQVKGPF